MEKKIFHVKKSRKPLNLSKTKLCAKVFYIVVKSDWDEQGSFYFKPVSDSFCTKAVTYTFAGLVSSCARSGLSLGESGGVSWGGGAHSH